MAAEPAAPDGAQLRHILAVASEAARKAGAVIREFAGAAPVEKSKAGYQDLVTLKDQECQELIYAHFKGDAVTRDFETLGEEDVPPGEAASVEATRAKAAAEWLIVVDPIDGTTNFVHGLPLSVVSIGIARQGQVCVGVIYEPARDELFAAALGQGATLNGVPMHVSGEAELKRALWGFGLHHQRHIGKTMLRGIEALVERSRGARALGSAALMVAYTACGRLTGFFELGLNAWDLAAGVLLVAEAGGRVSDMRGDGYTLMTRDILVSNGAPAVHDGALALLAGAGAQYADAAEKWPPLEKA